ncbi:MAG: hypothetical protein HKN43_00595 [Rhodothermales bacterium]|nr:hypothetical protein [Rhodothermales bacterium]
MKLILKTVLSCLVILALSGTPMDSVAQQHQLHASLVKSKGYVVGSPLSRSGFHRLDSREDTTWSHIGWNVFGIAAFAIDPGNKDRIFLAGGNGVFRSLDGGESWKIVTGWEVTEGQGIAIDPANPNHVYVATAYGVWSSFDGGETWEETNRGFSKTYTQNIAVDRIRAGRLVAATDAGIYISERAEAWRRVTDDVPIMDIHQSNASPNLWAAATRGRGVWISRDGADSWLEVRSRRVRGAHIHAVALDPTNEKKMAAGGWQTGVLISNDGGMSWKRVTKNLPSTNIYEMVFDPDNPGRLYVATIEEGVVFTDNDGRSWESAGMHGTLFFDMQFVDMEATQ